MSGKRCKALRAEFRLEHGRAVLVTRWERTALGYRVHRGEWRAVKRAWKERQR